VLFAAALGAPSAVRADEAQRDADLRAARSMLVSTERLDAASLGSLVSRLLDHAAASETLCDVPDSAYVYARWLLDKRHHLGEPVTCEYYEFYIQAIELLHVRRAACPSYRDWAVPVGPASVAHLTRMPEDPAFADACDRCARNALGALLIRFSFEQRRYDRDIEWSALLEARRASLEAVSRSHPNALGYFVKLLRLYELQDTFLSAYDVAFGVMLERHLDAHGPLELDDDVAVRSLVDELRSVWDERLLPRTWRSDLEHLEIRRVSQGERIVRFRLARSYPSNDGRP
jgi:hypothetical protein